jgi:chorismate mutase/prephenate dehydrogenase
LASSELREQRDRIRDIDAQILDLLRERLDVAREIGRIKHTLGLPLKDFAVEREVLARAKEKADALGLYQDLVEGVTRLCIKAAVRAQDEFKQKHLVTKGNKRIAIVGGLGRMGLWLADYFADFGHTVTLIDSAKSKTKAPYPVATTLEQHVEEQDFIVLSTPMSETSQIIQQLCKLKPKGVVFDICSLKSPVQESLLAAAQNGVKVSSIHPMFGPNIDFLAGRNILFCEHPKFAPVATVESLFNQSSAKILRVNFVEHDAYMSYVLGLSHFANLVFAGVLRESGFAYSQLASIGSTTFNAQMRVTHAVAGENPDLYYEIQAANTQSPVVYEKLKGTIEKFQRAIAKKDRNAFIKMMAEDNHYLDDGKMPPPESNDPISVF